ncbi:MAG: hypothetical protein ABW032_02390 [Burkholderiaceae bacterium]
MRKLSSWIRRTSSALCTWAIAPLILFEEWGWARLAKLMGQLARLPGISWCERRIAALPPRIAFIVLFVPMLLLLPVKVGALWLIAGGRTAAGVAMFVLAKVLGTGFVARLFQLTRPQLMRLGWFARGFERWLTWKQTLMARLRATLPWRWARMVGRRLRRQ